MKLGVKRNAHRNSIGETSGKVIAW